MNDGKLTNHTLQVHLKNGSVLGPYKAVWGTEYQSDVRDLSINFEEYLQHGGQSKYRYHLHDTQNSVAHSIILDFAEVAAVYDQVDINSG